MPDLSGLAAATLPREIHQANHGVLRSIAPFTGGQDGALRFRRYGERYTVQTDTDHEVVHLYNVFPAFQGADQCIQGPSIGFRRAGLLLWRLLPGQHGDGDFLLRTATLATRDQRIFGCLGWGDRVFARIASTAEAGINLHGLAITAAPPELCRFALVDRCGLGEETGNLGRRNCNRWLPSVWSGWRFRNLLHDRTFFRLLDRGLLLRWRDHDGCVPIRNVRFICRPRIPPIYSDRGNGYQKEDADAADKEQRGFL